MIEEAVEVVTNFLVGNDLRPRTARGWGYFLFLLGVIWFGAFGAFMGFREPIALVGLGLSAAGIVLGVAGAIFGSRRPGT